MKLLRAAQTFEQKRSSSQITTTLVTQLLDGFKEFRRSDSDIKLPWCLFSLEAQAEFLAPTDHAQTMISLKEFTFANVSAKFPCCIADLFRVTKSEILSFIIDRLIKATKSSAPKDIVALKTNVLEVLGCDLGMVTSEFAQMAQAIKHIFRPNAAVEEELVGSMAFVKEKAKSNNAHRLMVAVVHWPSGQICLQDAEDILAGARKNQTLLEELWEHVQSIREAQANLASREYSFEPVMSEMESKIAPALAHVIIAQIEAFGKMGEKANGPITQITKGVE